MMGILHKVFLPLLLVLLLAGGALSKEKCDDEAKNRLKSAWALKKTSYKQDPEVKREILLKTVESYKTVLTDFPDCMEACAEACFRMGEIHRTLKMLKEAERDFNTTFTYDKTGKFAARSLKEIGHIYRRAKEYDQASLYYKRVLEECPEQRDICADAYTWMGKVWVKQKSFGKARAIFIDFVQKFPEFPDEAIRNIDQAANTYLEEDNPDAASEFIVKWRTHFESLLGQDDRMDKKIEGALAKMKTPEKLEG